MTRGFLLLPVLLLGLAQAQTTRYGDAVVQTSRSLSDDVQGRAVLLNSQGGDLGLYIFCIDSRTPNVSVYFHDETFADYGYRNGARIPVTWQADTRAKVPEMWRVIGQHDDLRRYGTLGYITAELFKTQHKFHVQLLDTTFVSPARGVNTAMRQLPCVVPFLKSTGYLK